MKILILNGPNINLLQKRNPTFYGNLKIEEIENLIRTKFPEIDFEFFQTNKEYELIDKIHLAPNIFDGLIINPGGLSHSSVALRDALEMCPIPKVEVHLSNISSRDAFRKITLTGSVCDGSIIGFKHLGYILAVTAIININLNKS